MEKEVAPAGTEDEKPLWSPYPGKPQELAYNHEADEIFYGGAAGGGKTDLGLGLAINRHRRSLILRRESTQLTAIVERSKEIIGRRGLFNSVRGIWRLADGRRIEMGGCKGPDDWQKYAGRPRDLLVLDEAPQFMKDQAIALMAWVRTEDPNQKCTVLLTGNPPTSADGLWIIERYAPWLDPNHPNPAAPGELRWYAMVDGREIERPDGRPFCLGDSGTPPSPPLAGGEFCMAGSGTPPNHLLAGGELISPRSRTFIPARVDDNPAYVASGYKGQLQSLPEPLRSQLLNGDFSVGQDDDPWQVIPTEWVRAAMSRWSEHDFKDLRIDRIGTGLDGLGVDVARGGKDKTVLARRYGVWFAELTKHPGSSTPDGPAVAALVIQAAQPGTAVNVDIGGVGSSVYDVLVSGVDRTGAGRSFSVVGVNNAEASDRTDRAGRLRFVNKRAEMYWKFREALDPATGDGLALPSDTELLADLTAARWKMTVRGVQVESKEEIIKRLGRSPDCADAVVLAYGATGGPVGMLASGRKRQFGR